LELLFWRNAAFLERRNSWTINPIAADPTAPITVMSMDQIALVPSGAETELEKAGGPSYANDKSPRCVVIVNVDSFPETTFTAICLV
jgi:hypothetical protein